MVNYCKGENKMQKYRVIGYYVLFRRVSHLPRVSFVENIESYVAEMKENLHF